jgi:DNA-damage-inducible protein J
MSIQTTIQIRIEEDLKEKASNVLKDIGLDLSSGIKLFLKEVVTSESIPFFPSTIKGKKLLNYELLKKEVAEAKKSGKGFATSEEMLDDILNR